MGFFLLFGAGLLDALVSGAFGELILTWNAMKLSTTACQGYKGSSGVAAAV